jgi:hypothetical protein
LLLLAFVLLFVPSSSTDRRRFFTAQRAIRIIFKAQYTHNAHTHIHRRPNRENNKRATQPAQKTWLFLSAFFPPFPFLSRREPEKGPEANRPEQNKKEHADYKKRNGAVVMTTTFL